jgi:transcriptional antiterminator NusG
MAKQALKESEIGTRSTHMLDTKMQYFETSNSESSLCLMEDKIFNVIVPTEKKIKIKAGKRVEEEEKIYPGYVLVDMIVTDDSWYVVRNTPRVTGFVGSGTVPVPLDKSEVETLFKRMNTDNVKHTIDLSENDLIMITDGPFKDMEGKVSEVDNDRGKVKVLVSMFGRETPVELDFLQVKRT